MSAPMMNNNNNRAQAQTLSLYDPEFKNLITVPMGAVHHMPAAHLEISRLVLCRKYDPADPTESCVMGDSCKFVHIDMTTPQLRVESVHVNFAYRSLDDVPNERLPAGEQVAVMAPNGRAPSQLVPSEMILMTRGAMNRNSGKGTASHCAHYFYNRMCNRGERCSFLHCLFIDPSAVDNQRAPPRAGAYSAAVVSSPQPQQYVAPSYTATAAAAAPAPRSHHVPTRAKVPQMSATGQTSFLSMTPQNSHQVPNGETPHSHSEERLSRSSSLIGFSDTASHATSCAKDGAYRHNPYSLQEVTTFVNAP